MDDTLQQPIQYTKHIGHDVTPIGEKGSTISIAVILKDKKTQRMLDMSGNCIKIIPLSNHCTCS